MIIGTLEPTRATCGDIHIPGCHNARMNMTACLCGDHWWPGERAVLKTVPRYDHNGRGAQIIGWDTYWLEPLS